MMINSKFEVRNPKQILITKIRNSRRVFEKFEFRISNLFRASNFGFRIFLIICFLLTTGMSKQPAVKGEGMSRIQDAIHRNIQFGVRAPEFPKGLDWFNTPKPLTLADLKGKVVLLDFWTFCCINCMHVIPDLKKLEAKYPNELVVVGVHSAKFDNEKISGNIKASILRYELKHPVVNDHEMLLWRQYGVSSWPTIAVLDPEGRVVLQVAGEGNYDILDEAIGELIRIGERDGKLVRGSFELKQESDGMESEMLRFPGKVRAYPDRLIIADSNHNRILVTNLAGEILETIGSGNEGREDGTFAEAQFNHPQGIALDGDFIYIADTENHLLRKADLKNRVVETIAGTGQQALGRYPGGKALEVPLNSPWDIVKHGDDFYVAMAGAHQIWVYRPKKKAVVEPLAGNGGESIVDGSFRSSAFSQPSGLASDGKNRIYVADSEVSAVRFIDLKAEEVETLVGTGLFDFGDQDGKFGAARFQHCLGIEVKGDKVYLADTYNDRIKELDLARGKVRSIFGTGKEGFRDGKAGEAQFYEPGGLSVLEDKLYVADTNNHKIRVCDLKTGEVTTLVIRGNVGATGGRPASGERRSPLQSLAMTDEVQLFPQSVMSGKSVPISVELGLPKGFKFTPGAPLGIKVKAASGTWSKSLDDPSKELPARGELAFGQTGKDQLEIFMDVYYCEKEGTTCYYKSLKLIQPLDVRDTGAGGEIQVKYEMK